jgi:hypothetical protein
LEARLALSVVPFAAPVPIDERELDGTPLAADMDRDGDVDVVAIVRDGRSSIVWWERPASDGEHGERERFMPTRARLFPSAT